MGTDLIKVVLDYLNASFLLPELNKMLLVVIPKVASPKLITQFRPISLYNVAYKTITKAIMNRLNPFLPNFVVLNQTSFIPRRNITDNIIIYQEVLQSFKHKKGSWGNMMIKLDLANAYDHLEWEFIQDTLVGLGLPSHLIRVIMVCI